MKRLLCISCACCLLISMSACGKNGDSSSTETDPVSIQTETVKDTDEDIPAETEPETDPETEPQTEVATEEKTTPSEEESVSLSISTSQLTEYLDMILVDLLQNKGIEVNYTSDLIEFAAPQSVLDEVAADYRNAVNDLGKEPSGTIVSMEINEDYTDITFRVTSEFENSMDALGLFIFAQPVYEMQLLTGRSEEECAFTETVIDNESGEIISTGNFPEALSGN